MTGSANPITFRLRHARAMTNRRRNFICGGSFFFTANLAERRLRLLVDDIVSAKDDGFRCRSTHPTVLNRPTVLVRARPVGSVENDPQQHLVAVNCRIAKSGQDIFSPFYFPSAA
jgi:hypothetical protein